MTVFKKGDKVRVVRRVDNQPGWMNSWYEEESDPTDMTSFINNGVIYTVKNPDNFGTGVVLEEDQDKYGWPPAALELVVENREGMKEESLIEDSKTKVGPYVIEQDTVYRVGSYKFNTEKEAKEHILKWLLQDAVGSGDITYKKMIENAAKVIDVLKLAV